MRRARDGDGEAFAGLVRRYLRAARAVALAELGEPSDAEDACQDAFVTALERLEECSRPERFGGWLMQIVRNRARNLRRSRNVRATASLDEIASSAPGPSAERVELRDRLERALAELPAVQREIVLLHDLEGLRHAEIADALGMTEGASRVSLHRARTALRAALAPIRPEER
ncbi:MAG: RNA polymerase sigma factor [Gemmatimonadota bacterium]